MRCGKSTVSNSRGVQNFMNTQIPINLPEEIYKKAEHFAQLA